MTDTSDTSEFAALLREMEAGILLVQEKILAPLAPEERAEFVRLAAKVVPGAEGGELRTLAIQLRDRFGSQPAAVVLIGDGPKPAVVVATNSGARDRGLKAGQLVRVAAVELGGKGGGKDDLAQGGGTNPAAAQAAVDAAVRSAEATIAS